MWMTLLAFRNSIATLMASLGITLVLIPTLYVIFAERFPRAPMSLDNRERDAFS